MFPALLAFVQYNTGLSTPLRWELKYDGVSRGSSLPSRVMAAIRTRKDNQGYIMSYYVASGLISILLSLIYRIQV